MPLVPVPGVWCVSGQAMGTGKGPAPLGPAVGQANAWFTLGLICVGVRHRHAYTHTERGEGEDALASCSTCVHRLAAV